MDTWGGLPLVRSIADATPRCRLITFGRIEDAVAGRLGMSRAYLCLLDDGTGKIRLAFTGRSRIPGLTTGSWCSVEGTAMVREGELTVTNPAYELKGPGGLEDLRCERPPGD